MNQHITVDEVWYGKKGTPYEGVEAIVNAVTKRKVQVHFSELVHLEQMRLIGQVFFIGDFEKKFSQSRFEQLKLFD